MVDVIRLLDDITKKSFFLQQMETRSEKYCLISTLNIKNTFNSARWACFLEAVERLEVLPYLMRIMTTYRNYRVTRGVPQGSI